jgi:GT2 family glycosyltransferase
VTEEELHDGPDQVTVVVVTWNGAHLLPACLDGLGAQTMASRTRVLVVDNASVDATADVLARYPTVDVVRAGRNLGFAGGATLGLAQVRTPFAAVLNNDARPDPDWLEQLLSGFEPGVAAVTSKVLLDHSYVVLDLAGDIASVAHVLCDGTDITGSVIARPTGGRVELAVPVGEGGTAELLVTDALGVVRHSSEISARTERFDVLNSTGGILTPTGHGADRGFLEVDRGQYDGAVDVFAVCGAAAAFRTDVGRALGWFDPWLFAYYEDLDLSWRARRAGWVIRFVPAARVRHQHAATSRIGSDLFLFHNRRNRLAVLARNATIGQLVTIASAIRSTRPTPVAALLAPADEHDARAPHRGRRAAFVSFAGRMPRLLGERWSRRSIPSPTTPASAATGSHDW